MTPAISCLPVPTTPAINLSPVSLIIPCHRFSVIAGVVDTGNKFIANDNDTCVQDLWGVYGRVFSWRPVNIAVFSLM
jgi:hypothetical protein